MVLQVFGFGRFFPGFSVSQRPLRPSPPPPLHSYTITIAVCRPKRTISAFIIVFVNMIASNTTTVSIATLTDTTRITNNNKKITIAMTTNTILIPITDTVITTGFISTTSTNFIVTGSSTIIIIVIIIIFVNILTNIAVMIVSE